MMGRHEFKMQRAALQGFNCGGEVLIDVTARKILILEITT
jgi:hypothetical protein